MTHRCKPCGAPLTGADKCEYCGCLTRAMSDAPGARITYVPREGDLEMLKHIQGHAEMQRAAMMANQAEFSQRGMLFGGGVFGGLFR